MGRPIAGSYLGKGKLEEIKASMEFLEFDLVIANDELSPAQQRTIEKVLDVKVLDRTALILDVFAKRAQTHEGRLQVELAQLEYRLPRLTRMWTHLSRQSAGGVGLRGPGETQLEADRRESGKRISFLKRELQEVHRHRELYRQNRRERNHPVVALVGYTNAGKSTMINALTGSDVYAEDQLFATLDPTTRRLDLPSGREILITDTVGFINNLPTMVIAAFRATLEEINEASILIHVLDITHPNASEQAATVMQVLEELGADDKPIITALNKIDRFGDDAEDSVRAIAAKLDLPDDVIPISGVRAIGFDALLNRIEAEMDLLDGYQPVTLTVPYSRSDLVDLFHRSGRVLSTSHDENGTTMTGTLPDRMIGQFGGFLKPRPVATPRIVQDAVPQGRTSAPTSAA